MFDRRFYKKSAKSQLRGRLGTAALATLVSFVIIAILTAKPAAEKINESARAVPASYAVTESDTAQTVMMPSYSAPGFNPDVSSASVPFIIVLFYLSVTGILSFALCHLFNVYYSNPSKIPFSEFIRGFSHPFRAAFACIWLFLWLCFWFCLFIIPGLVKSFAYSQTFFILAENPKIGVLKAVRMSKIMTKGYKADLFVMSLSFIGWNILAAFTFGILQLWVTPYTMLSFTNAYKDLKAMAIRSGVLTQEDFNQEM